MPEELPDTWCTAGTCAVWTLSECESPKAALPASDCGRAEIGTGVLHNNRPVTLGVGVGDGVVVAAAGVGDGVLKAVAVGVAAEIVHSNAQSRSHYTQWTSLG